MSPRRLYLHETVDIVGQGQYEYMEHLWKDPVLRMPEMFGLQGSFYVCAAGGGRWPQVINIWDVGTRGWTGLGGERRPHEPQAAPGVLRRLVGRGRQVAHRRVRPAVRRRAREPHHRGAPAAGVQGTLFVHEMLTVRPGAQLDFLAAVVEQRVPLMREYGHEPTGLYEVLSNQHEVVMVWATDIPAQVRLRQNRDAARGLERRGRGRRPHRGVGTHGVPSSSPAATPTS